MGAVRRAGVGIVVAVVAAIAFLTAFAFVNVAAFDGLSAAIQTWLAALVLAGAWVVVGGSLSLVLLGHARRSPLWKALTTRPTEATDEELARARDEAAAAVRATLERLGPAIAVELASAAVPMKGEIAGEVVDAGGDLLEASDDVVEAIAEELPGGSVVNQIWDVVLMPGRFGVRVATTVLKRDGEDSDERPG